MEVDRIHERGYWLMNDTSEHQFDETLCKTIIYLLNRWKLDVIIDIGCGTGAYTRSFNKSGFICHGFDGNPYTEELSDNTCSVKDFSKPVNVGKYDLVLCLEVGEHIPEEYESIFFENIITATKTRIILSWAVEGQGGFGHVNNKNNEYIIDKMSRRDFKYDSSTSQFLRTHSTKSWFANTIMVFDNLNNIR